MLGASWSMELVRECEWIELMLGWYRRDRAVGESSIGSSIDVSSLTAAGFWPVGVSRSSSYNGSEYSGGLDGVLFMLIWLECYGAECEKRAPDSLEKDGMTTSVRAMLMLMLWRVQ